MPKGVYERNGQTHLWARPDEELRSAIFRASREILDVGERVSQEKLREHGVRGAHNRIHKIRKELIAAGDLPPEAGPTIRRTLHPRCESLPRPVAKPKVKKEQEMTVFQNLIREHKRRRPQDFRRIREKISLDKMCLSVDNKADSDLQNAVNGQQLIAES